MPKYRVGVCRIAYAYDTFEVEAANKKQAQDKAVEQAWNTVFSEHSSEYKVDTTVKLGDKPCPIS